MDNNNQNQENPEQSSSNTTETVPVNPELAEKVKKRNKRHKHKIAFAYSFLTFVLLFCIVQVGFSVILNTSKTVAYRGKIKTLTKVRDDAEQYNKDLKNDIKLFSKASSLEEIARNNLKMAGDDEILVIINNNKTSAQNAKKKKSKHKKN